MWRSAILITTTLLLSTCVIKDVANSCPFPSGRNFKRNLVINALHLPGSDKLLIIGTQ